jgi:hypothetical protein
MSKYEPLKEFLQNSNKTTIVLTFQEIEHILKDSLPPSASNHNAWWANDTTQHPHAKAWLEAGWLVESPTEAVHTHKVAFFKKTNENRHEKTHGQEKSRKDNGRTSGQEKPHNTPQEIFAYFNCPFPCDEKQLKNAYWEMIRQYHPDKVNRMGPEIKKLAEEKTKEINDMYEKALSYINLKGGR